MDVYVIVHKVTGERLSQLILCENDSKVLYGFREFVKSMKMYSPKTIQLFRIGFYEGLKIKCSDSEPILICNGDEVDSYIEELED